VIIVVTITIRKPVENMPNNVRHYPITLVEAFTTHKITTEFRRIIELNNGLLVYGMLLALVFSPLWPLDIAILLTLFIYMLYRSRFTPLTQGVMIVYLLSSFTSYYYVGFIVLSIYLSILMVYSRKYWLLAGSLPLYILLSMVLRTQHYLPEYYSLLRTYLSSSSYEFVGIHLVVLSALTLYTAMYTPYLRSSKIGGYFVENPGAYPIIQFILLLIYAAIQLAYGNEVLANKAAELAYYSLVIGVILSLKQVLSEREHSGQENSVS